MMRNFNILKNQTRGLSWHQCCIFFKKVFFLNKEIVVYGQDLPRNQVKFNSYYSDVKIEKGNVTDLEQLEQKTLPVPWEFQCHKYDGVKDFFVAKNAEGIQHISWIYFHNHHNRILSLQEQEAEIKFCLTLPGFRGRGIYPEVLCVIMDYLNSKGIHRVFICAEKANHPSVRGIEKAGFRRVGELRLRKVMGMQITSTLNTMRVR